MKITFRAWLKRFRAACQQPVVMHGIDLKDAWKTGESPAGVAVANDEIYLEHAAADAELFAEAA